jgi:N-acetyl-1-D-myo-inositol-2-amino-2-deoxy-alpha-D-glucopyranoside deacetylase
MPPSQPSLLAVFAHPDDEVLYGGLLSHVVERGGRVTLAPATMGEAGRVLDPAMGSVDDMPALRIRELRLACERLGIGEPRPLGFHDSGRGPRLRTDDPRALHNVDLREVVEAVHRMIADVRPQVVLTHEPLGGYYHPDHMTVHRAVTAAFFASGTLDAGAPQRLLYGARGRAEFLQLADTLRGRGVTDGLDADLFGVTPGMVALAFDATPYLEQKRGALAAHRSQFGLTLENMDAPPPGRPADIMRAFGPLLERELYLLGATRTALPTWPLLDVFDSLE